MQVQTEIQTSFTAIVEITFCIGNRKYSSGAFQLVRVKTV